MRLPTRSIIVGLLVLAGRRLTAPQVVHLARPLRLSGTNVKSHLTRLVKEGALERRGPARAASYALSASRMRTVEGIRSRIMESPDLSWDGAWLMLALPLPPARAARVQVRASLWFDGFRPVGRDTFVRPAWPPPWVDQRVRFYLDMTGGFCIRGNLVTQHDLARSYDLDGLNAEAERLAKWIGNRAMRIGSPRAAFIERMNVGGCVAQFIGHDPRLPRAVWGERRGMSELVRIFRRFDDRVAAQANRFVEAVCLESD